MRPLTLTFQIKFATKLWKILLLSIYVAKVDKVDSGSNCKNKIIKRLLFKYWNKVIDYTTLNVKQTCNYLYQAFNKTSILWHFDFKILYLD